MIVRKFKSDTLSRFKTFHEFENYGEINSVEDYKFYTKWARENNKKIYFVGNGSNTLFIKKKITSLVLKNITPKEIECISKEDNLYKVSSSVTIHEILNYCYKNSLNSFYFLASVPANVGGALAMNAGEGKHVNKAIYDFVESVTFIDSDGTVKTLTKKEMCIEHRKTMFTGQQNKFIVSAIFKFKVIDFKSINPIEERIQWSKKHQDNVAPNCGSIFSIANGRILTLLKGVKIGKAQFSKKTINWINNYSKSVKPILTLIAIVKFLHVITFRRCKVEIIRVK